MKIYQIYEKTASDEDYKKLDTFWFPIDVGDKKFVTIEIPDSNTEAFEKKYHEDIPIVYTLFPDKRIAKFLEYWTSDWGRINKIKINPKNEKIEKKIDELIKKEKYENLSELINKIVRDAYSIDYISLSTSKHKVDIYKSGMICTNLDLRTTGWQAETAHWLSMLVPI